MHVLSSGHTMQRGGHCNIYTPIPISYYQPIHCFSFHPVKFYLLLLTAHETISIRAKFKQIKTSSTAWQTQLAINDVCLLRFITAGKTVKCSVYESKWMKAWPTTLQAPDSALIFKFKQENRSRICFLRLLQSSVSFYLATDRKCYWLWVFVILQWWRDHEWSLGL